MFRDCLRRLLLCLCCAVCLWAPAALGQLSTEDHLAEPGFWPTQDNPSRDAFTGPAACARCHANKFTSKQKTPMADAAMNVSIAEILQHHPSMAFTMGDFTYQFASHSGMTQYTVHGRGQSLSYPLLWAFGTGRVGQSYLFKKPGSDTFYEARVTYFESLHTLGVTPFRALASPSGIDEAMDRPVPNSEVTRCFACHTTASTIAGQFDEAHLIPGVTCEACHGAGAAHIAAMDKNKTANNSASTKPAIFNSAHLTPIDAVDYCGACHGTWWDTKLSGAKGVSEARSAPYRLVTSKCWGKGDERLTCTACHDPHQQLQTDPAAYDTACLNCHVRSSTAKSAVTPTATAAKSAPACPVATERCTTCHMQKVFVPEMNDTFTDHRIRIAKAGEPFPE